MNDIIAAPLSMKRPVVEATFRTHDGVDLFYRHWPATRQPVRGALVFFHRGHEHSGTLMHLPDELDLPQFDCFAWDARGHGRSPGPRGFSPSFGTSVRDVQTFIDQIADTHRFAAEDIGVVAQGVSAVLVATFPSFARMAEDDRDALKRAFSNSIRIMWIISLPLAVAICICARWPSTHWI